MSKRFLVSVGDVVGMQGNNIVFTAKTLSDSGITIETDNVEIRGGMGNSLQSIYYHSGTFNITLTETQFKLPFIALNVGSAVVNGGNIWNTEQVTLNGYEGTLVGTPVAVDGQEVAVWTEYNDNYFTLPVSNGKFNVSSTGIAQNSTICVMYLVNRDSAQTVTVPADIIPDRLRLFITATLYGDTSGKGKIGTIQIEVPVAQLSGSQEISMTADGYSNTPLTAMALAYSDSNVVGCGNNSYYAKITEYIDGSTWYDGVIGLSIEQGDFEYTGEAKSGIATLNVWAVRSNGTSFKCDNSKLTFASSQQDYATIGEHTGVVNAVASGDTLLSAKITDKPSIETSATLTVSIE